MFGYQWVSIFEKAKELGIEQAKPEVLLLARWCRVYANPEERAELQELYTGSSWEDLHRILDICMDVADRAKSWKFPLDEKEELIVGDSQNPTP